MVVSAILTTALAPITGALFGASYGTAIRIGYEIIFPALFGNVKANPDAQDVIKSLHTMFQATGGAAAMEFGIDQGIEMAKKKTESPVIQHLINTDLGITEEQLARRHILGGQQDAAEKARQQLLLDQFEKGFEFDKLEDKVAFLIRNFTRAEIRAWKLEIDDGTSTMPAYSQLVINSAWAQLNDSRAPENQPEPVAPINIDNQPGQLEFKDWLSKITTLMSELLKRKAMNIITYVKTYTNIVLINDTAGRVRATTIKKNSVADFRKKMLNILVQAKNSGNSQIVNYAKSLEGRF